MNCQKRWLGTTLDMQTKFMLLFFGHKCLPFSLTWQVSLTCKNEFLRERRRRRRVLLRETEIEKNLTGWKKRVLDCLKLEYYKEVLNFSNIEYHIIFFNYTNSRLVGPRWRLTRNSSSLNSSTKKVIDY